MLFFRNSSKTTTPLLLALSGLIFIFAFIPQPSSFIPTQQDAGQQTALWTGATITTTTQSQTVACGQGAGAVGRKTLAVENQAAGGVVTVTVELRAETTASNHTSGYLAVNGLAAGSANSDTATPSEAGGRYCRVSAISASTSTITATLRRE